MSIEPAAFLAGLCSGVVGVIVGQPFDTNKVHRQVGLTVKSTGLLQYIKIHYKGIVPPLLTAGFIRALNFGIWQNSLYFLSNNNHVNNNNNVKKQQRINNVNNNNNNNSMSKNYTVSHVFMSGIIASCFTAPITQVVNILKVQEQVNLSNKTFSYKEFIIHNNIFRPGFLSHVILETFGSGVYYSTYCLTKKHGSTLLNVDDTNFFLRLIAGSSAGCMGWTAIYPLDTIRSRLLSLPRPLDDPTINARKLAIQIYKIEGLQGFYKGILPCLLRAAPVAACVLPTYDFVLDYFHEK